MGYQWCGGMMLELCGVGVVWGVWEWGVRGESERPGDGFCSAAADGVRQMVVPGVETCALPLCVDFASKVVLLAFCQSGGGEAPGVRERESVGGGKCGAPGGTRSTKQKKHQPVDRLHLQRHPYDADITLRWCGHTSRDRTTISTALGDVPL